MATFGPTESCCGGADDDDDTGWQLKVPDAEGRIEIRTSSSDSPPSELTEMLTGMRLGKPLVGIATYLDARIGVIPQTSMGPPTLGDDVSSASSTRRAATTP